jgi:hypothetical protein
MRDRAPLRLLVLLLATTSLAAGCGSSPSKPGGAQKGVLWISWTVKGQAVSDTTCAAIDHMTLTMETSAGSLEIEPIPCLRGLGWEYDDLPAGNDLVTLDAFDAHGDITLEGNSFVEVDATKPAMPAPIDLQTR